MKINDDQIVAILLYLEKGHTVKEAAQEFKIKITTLFTWLKKIKDNGGRVNFQRATWKRDWRAILASFNAKK